MVFIAVAPSNRVFIPSWRYFCLHKGHERMIEMVSSKEQLENLQKKSSNSYDNYNNVTHSKVQRLLSASSKYCCTKQNSNNTNN